MGKQLYISVLLWGVVASASPCTDGYRELIGGTSCSAYQECVGGSLHLKTCPPEYKFDTSSSSCLHTSVFKCADVGKCDQNFYPHPTLSSVYYNCGNGGLTVKVCPAGQVFYVELATCRPGKSYERPNIRKSVRVPCEEGVRKVSCKEYAVCAGGELSVRRCPLGEMFDDNSKTCTAGSCSRRPKRSVAACKEGTKRRVDGECKKYTECVNGVEVEKSCSPCTNFDDSKRLCTFVFENPCSGNPTAPPTDPTPKPTDPPTDPTPKPTDPPTDPTSKPTDPPTDPTPTPTDPPTDPTPTAACVEGEKRPDSKNCRKYFVCSQGILDSESCFILKHFDSKDLSCSWFSYTCAK